MKQQEINNQVLRNIDNLEQELVKIISNVIQIPSITPNYPGLNKEELIGGETRANKYLQTVMEKVGLETDLWEVENDRANLVGIFEGTGRGRSLILNGHIDTVPPGPKELWTIAGPYSGEVINRKIYGRGTTDMKSAIVAAIIAVKGIAISGYKPLGNVIIESVVGEEMMDTEQGTGATIDRGYVADAAIVMEPSAPPYPLAILTASPGLLIMKVSVHGKAAHTCMRHELIRAGGKGDKVAVSAVDKAFLLYQGLLNLEQEWGQTKSHPAFSRSGHFTICPATFMGGFNGVGYIPEDAYIEYVIWHAPQEAPEIVREEIELHIERISETDPWLRKNPPTVDWTWSWPPYDVAPNHPICLAVAEAYEKTRGEPPNYYGFSAVNDAVFLNKSGIPAISIGPGNVQVAHAANEFVEIKEVMDAAKIYAMTILNWCGIK